MIKILFTAIFSLIDSVILKTLPVSHPEQLLQVTMAKDGGYYTNPIWEQVRDRQDVFGSAECRAPGCPEGSSKRRPASTTATL